MMDNRSKIDPILTVRLRIAEGDVATSFEVFVRVSMVLDPQKVEILRQLGVVGANTNRLLFTARLPRDSILELSGLHWVERVSLAQQFRPMRAG